MQRKRNATSDFKLFVLVQNDGGGWAASEDRVATSTRCWGAPDLRTFFRPQQAHGFCVVTSRVLLFLTFFCSPSTSHSKA